MNVSRPLEKQKLSSLQKKPMEQQDLKSPDIVLDTWIQKNTNGDYEPKNDGNWERIFDHSQLFGENNENFVTRQSLKPQKFQKKHLLTEDDIKSEPSSSSISEHGIEVEIQMAPFTTKQGSEPRLHQPYGTKDLTQITEMLDEYNEYSTIKSQMTKTVQLVSTVRVNLVNINQIGGGSQQSSQSDRQIHDELEEKQVNKWPSSVDEPQLRLFQDDGPTENAYNQCFQEMDEDDEVGMEF